HDERDAREQNKRAVEAEFADILNDDKEGIAPDGGEEAAADDAADGDQKTGRLKRVLVGMGVICAFLCVSVLVVYLWLLGGRTSDDMSLRVGNANETERSDQSSSHQPTAEEIARALNGQDKANNQTTGARNGTTTVQPNGNVPVTTRPPSDIFSTTVPDPLASASPSMNGERAGAQTGATSTDVSTNVARNTYEARRAIDSTATRYATTGASSERSIRANPPATQSAPPNEQASLPLSWETAPTVNEKTITSETSTGERTTVALPPLGTMLPVRTLGAVYTLRSETLVRMQLTRAMRGAGWSLRRGTELYGTVRGSDFEVGRAYIALVGFIDAESGRLVRLEGNILGGDGTDGLHGRKHRLGGGWSRALRVAGAGALDALGAIAGSLGRRPIVVADVYGNGGVNPMMNEIGGISYRNNRSGFVEVPAGSSGYVLVMQMPRDVQGVDAGASLGNLNSPELERLADSSISRAGTQLSDEQLAALITTGTPEQIRAGMPHMRPEMRRISESVLASMGSGGKGR
ncbi:MAG: hypothetical protein M3458_03400, partial [Acidobacteriota bacterium]|nr:hypothetical protein [Acidobacteriota bacterium]